MRRLRVDLLPLEPGSTLPDGVAHHLENVLRARADQHVLLFDGAGREQEAVVRSLGPLTLDPAGPVRVQDALLPVHLVLSVLKHQAMDLALRMAVEAGATHIHPVLMERTVAKGDRADRWERILSSAATQCGRADLPILHGVERLDRCLDQLDLPVLFGAPGAPRPEPLQEPVALVIGPAGGLSDREATALLHRGGTPIGMGPHILRAETAVAVGLGLLRA